MLGALKDEPRFGDERRRVRVLFQSLAARELALCVDVRLLDRVRDLVEGTVLIELLAVVVAPAAEHEVVVGGEPGLEAGRNFNEARRCVNVGLGDRGQLGAERRQCRMTIGRTNDANSSMTRKVAASTMTAPISMISISGTGTEPRSQHVASKSMTR